MNKHRQMTKSSVIGPERYTLTGTYATEDDGSNYSTAEDEIQNLMDSEIPAAEGTKRF